MSTAFDHLQTFLLIIFFVYFCFSIFFKFVEMKANTLMNELIIALVSGIAIVLCMTFPITFSTGYSLNFLQIPLIIGALYGGRRVTVFLTVILVTYRLFLNSPDTDTTLLIYCLLLVSLWYIIPLFNKAVTMRMKVFLALLASFFGLFSRITKFVLLMPENITMDYFIIYIASFIIQPIGILFFVVFNENSRRNAILSKVIRKFEKLKTVSELAASISHEVRNPLTVTRGFIQLLRDPNLTEEEKKLYINFSMEALDKAEATITDYLTFAKPSLDHVERLDLKKELDYIANIINPFAEINNVMIECQNDMNIYITGGKQQFHQCLINLIKNGIESMPDGGKMHIHLQKINEKAVITVTDTGMGMTDEQMEQLGTPYYTTKVKGTGLGTMVMYNSVKAMQGEIKVESEVGRGTRFSLFFPVTEH
ncbi:sensor histidine kinase [Domibacillus mangrovi]|uniref:histidine kinase n=1 Tax=Domibacillus mangrovi TaxID=1714354 RepID=A0A1Q5P5C9_9BACI|nr:sensor histidine kinase [Domibacillus mangrovi]OKL37368.1 two-component sensor histidine kinase [Domibacillus mangrovi]